jgi:hypothetical protein
MVLALVGDSTMTSAVPPERLRAPFPAALTRLLLRTGALATGVAAALASFPVLADFADFPVPSRLLGAGFLVFLVLVAIASV